MTKRLIFLMVFALIAASCSDSTTDTTIATTATPLPESTASTSTTTLSTTTTTTQPMTTSEPVEDSVEAAAAQFDTTGDDFVAVMMAWHEMFNYFEHEPNGTAEEIVDLLYTPDYHIRDGALADFGELIENDWRYADPGATLWGVRIVEAAGNRAVLWEATDRGRDTGGLQLIVDSAGNEIKTYDGWPLMIRELVLTREDSDARWRIQEVPLRDTDVELTDLKALEFDWIAENI